MAPRPVQDAPIHRRRGDQVGRAQEHRRLAARPSRHAARGLPRRRVPQWGRAKPCDRATAASRGLKRRQGVGRGHPSPESLPRPGGSCCRQRRTGHSSRAPPSDRCVPHPLGWCDLRTQEVVSSSAALRGNEAPAAWAGPYNRAGRANARGGRACARGGDHHAITRHPLVAASGFRQWRQRRAPQSVRVEGLGRGRQPVRPTALSSRSSIPTVASSSRTSSEQ